MRGKVKRRGFLAVAIGITPAYAGKSLLTKPKPGSSRDHPRVCGEKWGRIDKRIARKGSPPRMRGKVTLLDFVHIKAGITPAYAGKSLKIVGWENVI